jgi:hypothetical protein
MNPLGQDNSPELFWQNRNGGFDDVLIFDMACKAEVRWQLVRDKIGQT